MKRRPWRKNKVFFPREFTVIVLRSERVERVQKIILPEKTLCSTEAVVTELKVMDAALTISAHMNEPSSVAKLDEFVSKYGDDRRRLLHPSWM